MKKKITYLLCSFLLIGSISMAQATKKTETIKVHGNCDMCKEKIEGSLKKKDGIISKKWDVKTHILSVTYDASKIDIKQIGQKVADAGYDNEYATAKDETYNKLHHCCKYERPKKK
ncbi:MAG TPA: cation transporter [Bacteroidia bacterium]|nr:cation transporter [Bacteroidia bacterium]